MDYESTALTKHELGARIFQYVTCGLHGVFYKTLMIATTC